MLHPKRAGAAALLALTCPTSAMASYDDWMIFTPGSTGMMGEWVYDVLYDDATGRTWIAADDPIWDEGGFASTEDGLTWDTYSNVNGEVPAHAVHGLTMDADGNLWMASDAGLLRFDGVSTEVVWSTANAPEWPHDGVADFDWDSEGNLWVALSSVTTVFGGLAKWDGTDWTVYTTDNGLPWTSGWDNVARVTVDPWDRVWIGSDVLGAAVLDGTTWTWFEPDYFGLRSNWVTEILVEDADTVWFAGMGGGLSRLDGTTWTTWDQESGPFGTNDISGLTLDDDGDVWITTFIGTAWEYDGTSWTRNAFPLSHVYGLDFDASGEPIAGGIGGLVLGDGQLYTPFAVSLSDRWIDAIEIGADGTMWFAGGGGGGVSAWDGTTWRSWNPKNEGLYEWPFATDGVEDIVEGLDGHIFVNAVGHGIGEWDGAAWVEHIPTSDIEVMAIAPDGTLWAGPYNGAELVTYDGSAWTQVNIPYTGWYGDMLALAVDPNGDVWHGSINGLLHSTNGRSWTSYTSTSSDLPDNYVRALQPEPDGSGIWIGTANGLAFFDGSAWTVYTEADSGLPANAITALAIAPDGALWVGAFNGTTWPYYGGLARFDGTSWRSWTTESSDLPHEQIWSIAIDPDGNAWIGTASEGIGLLYVGEEALVATPTAFTISRGSWLEGTAASMASSDDVALRVQSATSGTRLLSTTAIDIPSPVIDPTAMTISVELGSDGPLTATFSIRNVATGAWEVLGTPERIDGSDESVMLTVTEPADHVASRGGLVKIRVATRASAASNPGGVSVGLDHVELSVTD